MPGDASAHSGLDRATASKAGQRPSKYSVNFKPHSSLAAQKNLISAQEMEENFVRSDDGGTAFRLKSLGLVLVAILSIGMLKYDVEYNLQPHGADMDEADDATVVDPVARKYYEQLHVPVDAPLADDGSTRPLTKQEIRRERHRLKKAAAEAFQRQTAEHSALVHVSPRQEKQYNQVKIAYEKIHQKIDRNLYDVLGVSQNDPVNAQTLGERAEKLRQSIEAQKAAETDDPEQAQRDIEDKEIALQDVKDAYDILSQPESRVFYNLYGLRPPEEMKHTSARAGGWGQDYAFSRAYHVKLALMLLKYIDSYALDVLTLVSCISFIVFAMWRKYPELKRVAQQLEDHEERMKALSARGGN